jgi:hypothetical protein
MRLMAELLRRGRYADEAMGILAAPPRGGRARRAERSLPVRQRAQGQALPRRGDDAMTTGVLGFR